ncbi:MAG TPA: DNA-binding transcriptional regulator Fis [Gammaproteobacteria bacterium]|nr:DNA-binding transcriptional regulator Fis [Gammaproteobacteria bacterium]
MSEALHIEPAPLAAKAATSETEHRPLRDCVTEAMARYFDQLDGHPAGELYRLVLAEVEEPLFRAVMDYTGGNQSKASELLGINRGTLRKKLKMYGLHD